MKIRLFVLSGLVLALILFSIIPYYQEEEGYIAATFDNAASQVMQPDNWKNWFPRTAGGAILIQKQDRKDSVSFQILDGRNKYRVRQLTLLSYEVTENSGHAENRYSFVINPLRRPDSVKVISITRTSFFFHLFPFLKSAWPARKTINGLRSFLENRKAFYGFPIEIRPVKDTVFLTRRFVSSRSEMFRKIRSSFMDIDSYIKDSNLLRVECPAVAIRPLRNDSLSIMTGIAVNKITAGRASVSNMLMPKGRMLVGAYRGRFGERQRIYNAMENYVSDNHLAMVATGFEVYLNGKLPDSDSSIIEIELYFPIF